MYIVTFYSFKGGTGRSMTLVNVAADLLARGRRVLLVDFDLEAPGLDTFPMKFSRPLDGGIVEMVAEYLSSPDGEPPSVLPFLYEAEMEGTPTGKLWIMPAGRQDNSYESRFRGIDWLDFYVNEGGFLFFEDLKIQWEESIQPDYVLIDSRTGHTDIGGICTRQLADCVTAVFFPNEQNLRGLIPVVRDIRLEESGPLQKQIDLHFVMSNVPDMDDENEIFSRAALQSKQDLGYQKLAAVIHHFNSLSMLEQRLLLVERPKSKIATEYRELANAIVRGNLQDRDGAIAVLERALAALRSEDALLGTDTSLEKRLQSIRILHAEDVGVLLLLARFRRAQRRMEEALDLFEQILQIQSSEPESLIGRAEILINTGKKEFAIADIIAFCALKEASPFSFAAATRLVISSSKELLTHVVDSPMVPSLPLATVMEILQDLQKSYDTCDYCVELLRRWMSLNSPGLPTSLISNELALALIASGRFEEAQLELRQGLTSGRFDMSSEFNFAMAEWGRRDQVPNALFEEFIRKFDFSDQSDDANFLQCYAIAHWAGGSWETALAFLRQAEEKFMSAPRTIFSGWTYLYRSPRSFRSDLAQVRTLLETGFGTPGFIRNKPPLFRNDDAI